MITVSYGSTPKLTYPDEYDLVPRMLDHPNRIKSILDRCIMSNGQLLKEMDGDWQVAYIYWTTNSPRPELIQQALEKTTEVREIANFLYSHKMHHPDLQNPAWMTRDVSQCRYILSCMMVSVVGISIIALLAWRGNIIK